MHTRRNYSRLARVEEKKNVRSAITYGLLSLGILIIFFFFGLPLLAKFAGFLSDLGSSNRPVDRNDTIPPAPPQIDSPSEYTNKTNIDITGTTEAGASVKVFVNKNEQEVVSGSDGRFTLSVSLDKGENKIYATAKDATGNTSEESERITINFDNDSPKIELKTPSDGASFSGSKQKQLTIEGETEEKSEVTVNGKLAQVDSEGNFKVTIDLTSGANELTIKSIDLAGNQTEKFITVNYSE